MTTKATPDARVRFTAGPAAGLYGHIISVDESSWSADIRIDDGRTARGVPMKHLELVETTTDREKLLNKIRKLHAKAESAKGIGNEAEALAFASKVVDLLARHKLDLTDLEMTIVEAEDPMGNEHIAAQSRGRVAWAERLASVIARAHFCRVLIWTGSDAISFVGRASDRRVAAYVFVVLRRWADTESDKAARKFRKEQRKNWGATTGTDRNYRAAWLEGFVTRIAERYEAEDRAFRSSVAKQPGALIRLDNAHQAVQQYMQQNLRTRSVKAAKGTASANDRGRSDGRKAGDSANIRGTGLGGGTSSTTPRGFLN